MSLVVSVFESAFSAIQVPDDDMRDEVYADAGKDSGQQIQCYR